MDVKRMACGGRAFTDGGMDTFVGMYVCMCVCMYEEMKLGLAQ